MVNDKTYFIKTLNTFEGFEENWDSYGAPPIPLETIEKVKKFILEHPLIPSAIAPSVNDDILLEYGVDNKEVQLYIGKDKIEMLCVIINVDDYTKDIYEYEGLFDLEVMNKFLNNIE